MKKKWCQEQFRCFLYIYPNVSINAWKFTLFVIYKVLVLIADSEMFF